MIGVDAAVAKLDRSSRTLFELNMKPQFLLAFFNHHRAREAELEQ